MTFKNEWITPEIIKQYNMEQDYDIITKPFKTINGCEVFLPFSRFLYSNLIFNDEKRNITIDTERDMYLRYGGSGNPMVGVSGWTYYIFYYQGKRIYFSLEFEEYKESDNENKHTFYRIKLQKMYCKQDIKADIPEIHKYIKEALDIYYESGVRSSYIYHNQYNF